jgi:hypothetical protein
MLTFVAPNANISNVPFITALEHGAVAAVESLMTAYSLVFTYGADNQLVLRMKGSDNVIRQALIALS